MTAAKKRPARASARRYSVLRLVGVFAVLCIVPLALLTYFTINLADRAVVREVNARVKTTSAVTAALVQQQMQAVSKLTASYGSRPILIAAVADGNPANFDDDAINRQLTQLRAAQPGSGGAFFTDLNCRLTQIRPATPAIVGVSFTFRDWCKGVTASGGPYVSDVYRTAAIGRPLVVAAAVIVRAPAVDGRAGKPLGILASLYTLEAITGYADRLARAQGVQLTITDRRGVLIVGGGSNPGGAKREFAIGDSRIRGALAGRSGVTRSTIGGSETLSAFAPVGGVGWAVVADIPARQALAGVRDLRSRVLSIAGLLGLILAAGLGLLARTLRLRREAERALIERESNTRAILEAATDAFVSMDADGMITAWNGQAEQIFGWTETEALGRRLTETIIPPSLRASHDRGLAHFLATGVGPVLNERIEVPAMRRDGQEFPAELAIWPVPSQTGWSFNAFVRDITHRKLTEADLAEARDQALEASRLKSEFLANMSHEIRTPMNGVLGMTSVLLETDLDPEQRDMAETVVTSGEALLGILNDILDFSKVEAGHLDLEVIDVDLAGLVDDVARLFRLSAEHKGLELTCSLAGDLPRTITGDPGRLRQVLINLVGNGIKFTDSGRVDVRVTHEEVAGEDVRLRFEVSDTGPGIASDKLDLIFQPFIQADTSVSRKYGGTGLGLAISGQLVTLMGGSCGATSRIGAGSTFWFTICVPARPDTATHEVPPHPLTAVGAGPKDAGAVTRQLATSPRLGRLLVVEDNLINQKVATAMLVGAGYDVDTVSDGAAAVKAAADRRYDTILMDCQMPEMNGYEATAMIRAHEGSGRYTPIVALTAGARPEDRERCLAEGMDDYIAKPIDKPTLLQVVAESVQGGRS